jgi:PAS domain S-box-containing protein
MPFPRESQVYSSRAFPADPRDAIDADDPQQQVINELRRELKATRASSEASRLILEAAGEGIYGLDLEGNTTFANPAAEMMIGWTADELIGISQHAAVHHSHADGSTYPRELCPIYMALRDGKVHFSESEVFWRKDGTCFPVEYTSTPILRNGCPAGAVVIFNDISERKRREEWELKRTSIIMAVVTHASLETTTAMMTEAFSWMEPASAIAIFTRSESGLKAVASAGSPGCLIDVLAPAEKADSESAWTRTIELGVEAVQSWSCPQTGAPGMQTGGTRRLVPVLSSTGTVLGIVAFFFAHKPGARHVDKTVWDASSRICDLARLAFEDDKLHSELLRQSQYDHLTGLQPPAARRSPEPGTRQCQASWNMPGRLLHRSGRVQAHQ